jgi:RES domain-containing protein
MKVFRVSKKKYASDLSGEGAKLFGGRWNKQMTACVYTSESRALAVLEYTVNVAVENMPPSLSIATIEIPDDEIFVLKNLPFDWNTKPVPSSTQILGTELLQNGKLIIKVPSVVIASEYNYLLNPAHAQYHKIKLLNVEMLDYDLRIKQ